MPRFTSTRTGFFYLFYSAARGSGTSKKKNFIINSIYTNNIFFKHGVPRFTSARTGFFYFTSPKAMARFRGSLPTRSVVQGSGSFSLKGNAWT